MKKAITLYLHIHQPWRVREYSVFDTARNHDYFAATDGTERDNKQVLLKVTNKSYRPMNNLLEKLLREQPEFKLSLSITGTWLEQAKLWAPDLIDQIKRLVDTGRVEIVGETYEHSLAFFYSRSEFIYQVNKHHQVIKDLFDVEPTAFRNTELAYNDELAAWADEAGYKTILAEGWDPILEWRSPNYVYRPAYTNSIRLLLKNYRLSDDLAFRFGNRAWPEWPLTVDKYYNWMKQALSGNASTVNLFMDYETFGEHQWDDTGIFEFFESFTNKWLEDDNHTFYTVSQAATSCEPVGEISMPHTVTWADTERDLTAWLGNDLQKDALRHLYDLEHDILRSGDDVLIRDWRHLQTSDHAYYMCTKYFRDGDVHAYFSPYESPYDAFLFYMNAIRDLRYRLMNKHNFGGW